MNYARALFGFASYSDSKLLKESSIVIASMTSNTNFQNPSPTLNEVDTAYKKFQKMFEAAQSGDRVKIADKNIARDELVLVMRELCNYVNMAAKNVRPTLLSSGFKVSKEQNEPQVLGQIKNFEVSIGVNKNEIKASCERVENAVSYIFSYADTFPTDATIWKSNTATSSQTVFDKLIKGVEYFFRLTVVGRNNQRLESDIKSYICQ